MAKSISAPSIGVSIRRNPHECAVAKWAKKTIQRLHMSQPARMRCGKAVFPLRGLLPPCRNPHECAVAKADNSHTLEFSNVATRTNALWQRTHTDGACCLMHVATRTNALWQRPSCTLAGGLLKSQPARMRCGKDPRHLAFLIRNGSQPARMRCGKVGNASCTLMPLGRRNPHECAVAKSTAAFAVSASVRRNPHECAVAKR